MEILTTERLVLSEMTAADAPFMYQLLTMPSWLKYIGDRGIKNEADAKAYLENKIIPTYKNLGFGFYKVALRSDNTTLGICGIVKRDGLENIDIGYGFLEAHTGKGYALEATKAMLEYAITALNIKKIVAIVDPMNNKSIRLLEKIGLKYVKTLENEVFNPPVLLFEN